MTEKYQNQQKLTKRLAENNKYSDNCFLVLELTDNYTNCIKSAKKYFFFQRKYKIFIPIVYFTQNCDKTE